MPNGKGQAGRPGGQGGAPRVVPTPRPVQYFEAAGSERRIRPELLDKEAEARAKELSNLAPSQLRRFYDHVQSIDRRLKLEAGGAGDKEREAAFARLRPELLMLKAKAVYSRGRGTIPEPLLQFVVDHTAAVKSAGDFEAFRRHFEAVVAFHGFYGKKE